MSYEVGQRVWVYDVNGRGRGPDEATVTKVGRKLVTVAGPHNWSRTFRLEDGLRNDDYGHQWIRTDEEREAAERLTAVTAILAAARLRPEPGCTLPLDALEAIAAIVSGVSV